MTQSTFSRRAVVAGAVTAVIAAPSLAIAAAPATAAEPAAVVTPVARLWSMAEALGQRMAALNDEITQAARNGGISGWMRTGGEANELGHRRYETLVSILKETPRSNHDLALMGRAAQDSEMLNGPAGWASQQLAAAVVGFHGTRAA
jgi:hypothetical protein